MEMSLVFTPFSPFFMQIFTNFPEFSMKNYKKFVKNAKTYPVIVPDFFQMRNLRLHLRFECATFELKCAIFCIHSPTPSTHRAVCALTVAQQAGFFLAKIFDVLKGPLVEFSRGLFLLRGAHTIQDLMETLEIAWWWYTLHWRMFWYN